MKPVSGKRMAKILEGRGWRLHRVTGSHHFFWHPDFPDPVDVPIHGNKDLKPGTQRSIMKGASLTDADL